jgi:hypothetical protein
LIASSIIPDRERAPSFLMDFGIDSVAAESRRKAL